MLFCHRSGGTTTGIFAASAVVVTTLIPSFVQAAVTTIVNDRWADADRTAPASAIYSEYGVDGDSDGDLESAWYVGGTGATITTTVGHMALAPQPVSAGGGASASFTTYFTPEAAPITLAAAGDYVHGRWTFTPSNVNASNTSQNFRIAMVDSASRLAAEGAPPSGGYTGYSLFGNMGQTLGNSNPFQLRERTAANSDLLGTSGNWAALANGATSGTTGYVSGTAYTFDMTITRNAAAGVDILMTMSGGSLNGTGLASVSFTDATPSGFTYDTFAIRPSGATSSADVFDTSLFFVDTNAQLLAVPEPTTLAALAGGAIVLRRRRR